MQMDAKYGVERKSKNICGGMNELSNLSKIEVRVCES
jgi:hypothetical protein